MTNEEALKYFAYSEPELIIRDIRPDPYGGISDVAAKLGVLPHSSSHKPATIVTGHDGKPYDIFEVISALIDLLQRASDKPTA